MKKNLHQSFIALVGTIFLSSSMSAQCTAITPTVSNATVNCGSAATLTASGSSGFQWWDQSSGGTLLGSNATFTSPALYSNTSYFVEGTGTGPQQLMGLPAHSSTFTGNVRGYYFVAPVNFVITGLKEPVEVSGSQNIAVLKFTATPPLFSTTTNSFTTLFLTQNNPSTGIIPVNIQVMAGDIIGILGQAGTNNSYAPANYATTILGQPVTLARLGMQFSLSTTAPQDLWTEASGSISRVEMYYNEFCVSSRVQVDVTVNPIPVTANAANTDICIGSSTTLTAGGATNFTWMPGNITGSSISVSPTVTTTYTVTGDDPGGCSNTATVTINVNPLPSVVANSSAATICSGSTVTLTGSGATSYSWTGGASDGIPFSPSTTDTYTVTGTDIFGCQNTDMTSVTVNPLPTITASSTSGTICSGATVTLTGSGAVSYSWTGGASDGIPFAPTATDTYTVTGTDGNGCQNTDITTVVVNALPIVVPNATSNSICDGSSVTLTGSGATSYAWSGGVMDGVSFIPTATDTYTVTGTDVNGCENTATTTVTVNSNPTVNLGNDVVQCGGSVTLDASNVGSTYLWNTAATTQTISINTSGNYYVDLVDANGCMGSDTAMVTINTLPAVSGTSTSSSVCLSDAAVALTGTPVGGTWSGPGVTGSSFSPSTAGVGVQNATYSYTDANGCSNSASVTITVNACVSVAEQTLANGVSVYPNPSNGIVNLIINAAVGELLIEVTDVEGRVIYSAKESNTIVGSSKQINLENEPSGMYVLHLQSNGEQYNQKISIQH